MSNEKAILGGVNIGGTVYVPGQEADLAKVITAKQIVHLTEQGAIAGDWKSTAQAEKAAADNAAAEAAAKAEAAEKAAKEAEAKALAEKEAAERAAAEAAGKNK